MLMAWCVHMQVNMTFNAQRAAALHSLAHRPGKRKHKPQDAQRLLDKLGICVIYQLETIYVRVALHFVSRTESVCRMSKHS